MDYATLLKIHLATVALSLALFVLRGVWRMLDSPMLGKQWVKIVPHVNDTLLLAAAIGMLVVGGLNPLKQGWLMAKIAGLVVYIALGTLAIKRGETPQTRMLAFLGALLVFGYIVLVAVSKEALPF